MESKLIDNFIIYIIAGVTREIPVLDIGYVLIFLWFIIF